MIFSHHSTHHSRKDYSRSRSREAYKYGHRHRHRAMSRHRDGHSYSQKSSHKSYNDDSERDDSIGHFLGGKGDIIGNKYRILSELGTGTFAKAFEVVNIETNERCAVKVVRSIPRYCRYAKVEAEIAADIGKRDPKHISHCCYLTDEFEFSGHYCMVMPILGKSLYDVLKENDYRPFPMSYIRPILRHLLEAMQFMHSFGLTHTDLKLENLLFTTPAKEISVVNDAGESLWIPDITDVTVIDYGSATYSTDRRKGTINTRQYRAPEVLMGMEWDEESDIWGVACIAMELFTGDLLFQTHDDLLHYALIEKIVGKIPAKMISNLSSRRQGYFDSNGHFIVSELHHTEQDHVKNQKSLKELVGASYPQFYDLMKSCLAIAPNLRITAAEALMHPFFSGEN
ncbi:CLK protein kinase [Blastocystis sp. subtype 4]|uniref:CLK protein kinase n=1 Tax=Blastocystis sp. subtype 4 TaxID=944170 RepID=UPI000711F7F4|nr:CLK protein kinase [Blastocystis sp. subtype 4]KNB45485.1 CLK protein kinase [Blastocystis sp. subtype 4]|eukprot:XP_014528940.1 CLK protein kinase [Blastocystis sp. subtype 4]